MNKKELADRLARQSHSSRGEAADEVDKLVYEMLKDLKAAVPKTSKAPVAPVAKPASVKKERQSTIPSQKAKSVDKESS